MRACGVMIGVGIPSTETQASLRPICAEKIEQKGAERRTGRTAREQVKHDDSNGIAEIEKSTSQLISSDQSKPKFSDVR